MSRAHELPPPPAVPVRSPAVPVAGEREDRIEGPSGAPSLDARVHVPPSPQRAVVVCHPHPLYGGSMHSPVPLVVAKLLAERVAERVAWVRFDFRGVGRSEGAYDDGRGETDDVRAAIRHMRAIAPGVPVSVCGHSFGSWVGLRAAALEPGVDRVLLLAPSARFFAPGDRKRAFEGSTTIFIGDHDEYCDVDDAAALARDLGADLRVFDGQDHHFLKSRRALAEAALPILAPEVAAQ